MPLSLHTAPLYDVCACACVLTAEYIISLGNLTFETFSNAIREKYEDLYFEEDLVVNLFDAVNGRRPVAERR